MVHTTYLIDIGRILNGNTPAVFYIEIIIRAIVIYITLMIGLRFMGKRMASRVSRNELAAMASLAAAIGIPIQTPDRGLLPAIVMAIVVILVQRFIANRSMQKQSFERMTQGAATTLVEDGRMQIPEMKRTRISRERLVAQLRYSNIRHLGEVKRLYLEASGFFTLIRATDIKPGLTVLPDWDEEFKAEQKKADNKTVCHNCGGEITQEATNCPNCGQQKFEPAVY